MTIMLGKNLMFNYASKSTRSSGFTLIEVMIVVLIIGTLAAIAMASYDFAVTKSRRSAAASCALEGAQLMERYYTTKLKYEVAAAPFPRPCSQELVMFRSYDFRFETPTASTYIITARPIGQQLTNDKKCGTLTLNNKGTKTESGTAASASECW